MAKPKKPLTLIPVIEDPKGTIFTLKFTDKEGVEHNFLKDKTLRKAMLQLTSQQLGFADEQMQFVDKICDLNERAVAINEKRKERIKRSESEDETIEDEEEEEEIKKELEALYQEYIPAGSPKEINAGEANRHKIKTDHFEKTTFNLSTFAGALQSVKGMDAFQPTRMQPVYENNKDEILKNQKEIAKKAQPPGLLSRLGDWFKQNFPTFIAFGKKVASAVASAIGMGGETKAKAEAPPPPKPASEPASQAASPTSQTENVLNGRLANLKGQMNQNTQQLTGQATLTTAAKTQMSTPKPLPNNFEVFWLPNLEYSVEALLKKKPELKNDIQIEGHKKITFGKQEALMEFLKPENLDLYSRNGVVVTVNGPTKEAAEENQKNLKDAFANNRISTVKMAALQYNDKSGGIITEPLKKEVLQKTPAPVSKRTGPTPTRHQ